MRPVRRNSRRSLVSFAVIVLGVGLAVAAWSMRPGRRPAAPIVAVHSTPVPPADIAVGAVGAAPAAGAPQTRPTAIEPTPVAHRPAQAAPPVNAASFAEGKARFDAGDLIAARAMLSDALLAGNLQPQQQQAAREILAQISQQAIFGRRVLKDDPWADTYVLQPGDLLQKVAARHDVTWELLCRVNGIADPRKVRAYQTIKIVKGPFHAVITRSKFTMDIYLGSAGKPGAVYVLTWPVGLGKDDSTPVGTWVVAPHGKLKNPTYYSPRGEGIIHADDPKNPLGEFWIGLTGIDGPAAGKPSYGIHGTIEPESIGRQESLGCIRMHNDHVAIAFELLVEGKSTVVVRD